MPPGICKLSFDLASPGVEMPSFLKLLHRDLNCQLERELEDRDGLETPSPPDTGGWEGVLLPWLESEFAPLVANLDDNGFPLGVNLDTPDAHTARAGDHIVFVTHSEGGCIDDCEGAFPRAGNTFESQFYGNHRCWVCLSSNRGILIRTGGAWEKGVAALTR